MNELEGEFEWFRNTKGKLPPASSHKPFGRMRGVWFELQIGLGNLEDQRADPLLALK